MAELAIYIVRGDLIRRFIVKRGRVRWIEASGVGVRRLPHHLWCRPAAVKLVAGLDHLHPRTTERSFDPATRCRRPLGGESRRALARGLPSDTPLGGGTSIMAEAVDQLRDLVIRTCDGSQTVEAVALAAGPADP